MKKRTTNSERAIIERIDRMGGDAPWLLRVPEAAQRCQFSTRRLYQLIAAREFPFINIGGALRVPVAGLKRWIESKTSNSIDEEP